MIESERDVGSNREGGLFFGHGLRNIDNAGDDYLSLKSNMRSLCPTLLIPLPPPKKKKKENKNKKYT